jgi:hypothetical protein
MSAVGATREPRSPSSVAFGDTFSPREKGGSAERPSVARAVAEERALCAEEQARRKAA